MRKMEVKSDKLEDLFSGRLGINIGSRGTMRESQHPEIVRVTRNWNEGKLYRVLGAGTFRSGTESAHGHLAKREQRQ